MSVIAPLRSKVSTIASDSGLGLHTLLNYPFPMRALRTILSDRDWCAFLLESFHECLVPVFHVRRNGWLDPFESVSEVFQCYFLCFNILPQRDPSGFATDCL